MTNFLQNKVWLSTK